jgi:aminopeptidase-like protein
VEGVGRLSTSETPAPAKVPAATVADLPGAVRFDEVAKDMHGLIAELYPICRSITGNGVRETLARISERIPLEIEEVPTGTPVFDWTVPKEWNIQDAYIETLRGERVVDFSRCNLHVVSYSAPIRRRMKLSELRDHVFTLPERPDWIPYRTSYYNEAWGFCMSQQQLDALRDEEYEVCIDSSLEDGQLTYAECYLEGLRSDEVLISCHVCHPSLCNDNLSGIAVATALATALANVSREYSYRFLFVPGTIGSITWLARNENRVSRIKHGVVLTCVGDSGDSTYKKSRRGDAEIDRAFEHVLRHSGKGYEIEDFSPYGYDERQYCSPGFDLPVGCLMRTPHGQFPQYHTSADDLALVRPECLADTLRKCLLVFDVLERNRNYVNLNPKCEPQLGRRGLYQAIGGAADRRTEELAMLWVLNQSDGSHTLLDIAAKARLPFATIAHAAEMLGEHELLEEIQPADPGRPA